jgi:hypothetical protein
MKKDIASMLVDNIVEKNFIAIMEALEEDDQHELMKLTESGDKGAVKDFLVSKIPDFEELIKKNSTAAIDRLNEIKSNL